MAEKQAETAVEERGRRQVLTGTVVSDKQDKTVTVAVESTYLHPLYHRIQKRTSKYAAHDEANECREGDRVVIVQSRPLSRRKRWRVRDIVRRAQ
jgi:small subunit ribosomal protein S17